MRLNTLLLTLLGLPYVRITSASFGETGLEVGVAPTWRAARCSSCGFNGPCYDRDKGRRWRHLDACGMTVHLRYDTRRVDCARCGVTVEHVPWANASAWFTQALKGTRYPTQKRPWNMTDIESKKLTSPLAKTDPPLLARNDPPGRSAPLIASDRRSSPGSAQEAAVLGVSMLVPA